MLVVSTTFIYNFKYTSYKICNNNLLHQLGVVMLHRNTYLFVKHTYWMQLEPKMSLNVNSENRKTSTDLHISHIFFGNPKRISIYVRNSKVTERARSSLQIGLYDSIWQVRNILLEGLQGKYSSAFCRLVRNCSSKILWTLKRHLTFRRFH